MIMMAPMSSMIAKVDKNKRSLGCTPGVTLAKIASEKAISVATGIAQPETYKGLESLKNKYPHEISGGEQQRVALARSLAPNPKLLMLDEPFSALDKDLKGVLYEEISQVFSERGSTILLVTHDSQEAEIMTKKQMKMEKGQFL